MKYNLVVRGGEANPKRLKKQEYEAMTIMPEGDAIRKAVKWISGELQEDPNKSLQKLVNNASLRFNLSPKESEFLMEFYRKDKEENPQ
jgi:hypothetical protein